MTLCGAAVALHSSVNVYYLKSKESQVESVSEAPANLITINVMDTQSSAPSCPLDRLQQRVDELYHFRQGIISHPIAR